MGSVHLIQGDALEVLETLVAGSFDACLCDPPYGIGFMGKQWDRPGAAFFERKAERGNTFDHVGGNHNPTSGPDRARTRLSENAKFQAWCEGWSRAVLRCLRPGASLMAFGGTRTYHRLAVAIEDAGLEIRDSILVPGVVWAHGQGFAKGINVSTAVDSAAGAEREVVGSKLGLPGYSLTDGEPGGVVMKGNVDGSLRNGAAECAITAPATPEAARWEGFNGSLKPAWEPVVWAMKPVDGTFSRNAMEHGVAGLNVDAGRVGLTGGETPEDFRRIDLPDAAPRTQSAYAQDQYTKERFRRRTEAGHPEGRFPANLILAHLPGCRREGTKRVATGTAINRNRSGEKPQEVYGGGWGIEPEDAGYADPDGTEEVAAWECVEGCPVLAMDRASGESEQRPQTIRRGDRSAYQNYGGYPNQAGTASRFFQQCAWEPGEFEERLLYYAKAATAERMVDGERLLHPTMKPLALVTYLARLLLPPPRQDGQPRRLLVPFSGVGSEVIGALRAGWDEVTAIELDADGDGWIEKSARRIRADAPLWNTVEIEKEAAP